MNRLRMVALAAALLAVGAAAPAGAGDLGGAPSAPLAPPVLPEDFSSGWYVRGDFTAGFLRPPSARTYDVANFVPGRWVDLRDTRGATAFGGGLGLGFKYKWLRLDATLDLRSTASLSGQAPPLGDWSYAGPLPVPSYVARFGVSSQSALINGYLDLGGWSGITPYLGAGIGVARLSASHYSAVPVPAAAALGETTFSPALARTTKWTLAWALMAGVSVDITPQAKLDLGYRYMHMGALAYADTAGGAYRTTVAAHELRIGLRYMFGDGLPAGN